MNNKEVSDGAIEQIAKHIHDRMNRPCYVPIAEVSDNAESAHYFDIVDFTEIDDSEKSFFAIDGSYNSQEFYNGITVGLYTAGYVGYRSGKQIRLNSTDDIVVLGKSYFPNNILVTCVPDSYAVFDELLELPPVKSFLKFLGKNYDDIWGFGKSTRDVVCSSVSKLLPFCQEILEWSLVYEISNLDSIRQGDFILRDGTLRSTNIKQDCLVKLGEYIYKKGFIILAITKKSPIKLELSSSFKAIDSFLEGQRKRKYPSNQNSARFKKGVWFEVSESVLMSSYSGDMYARKGITGGRGVGLFFAARLDYIEKLQNYDWVIVDLNIFNAVPMVRQRILDRNIRELAEIFLELTRLTQEHYILGYPYPLVEAHNFVTLKSSFKDEVLQRVKFCLYSQQQMDNVDIENIFLDIHDRF
jgi:hypothetical protein